MIRLGEILKTDEEHRVVYGWASVISENGAPVIDNQGDVIEPDELLKATTQFMLNVRKAKLMHKGGAIGEVIHSFPLVSDIAKAFGIDADREGWIVGVKIHSDQVWKQIKQGTFRAFSIGAEAEREEVI